MKTPFNKCQILLFLLFSIFLNYSALLAQVDWSVLSKYYQNAQYSELQQALTRVSAEQKKSMEFLFFSTLFEKDGEKAIQNYQYVFEHSQGWLKKAAAKKLFDYYFARGLYLKAESYKNYLSQEETTQRESLSNQEIPEQEETVYSIQLGAFSSPENARKRLKVLEKNGISAEIKIRKINDHNYYCVWVKGRANFADTEKMARQIKKQLKLDYRIIKE